MLDQTYLYIYKLYQLQPFVHARARDSAAHLNHTMVCWSLLLLLLTATLATLSKQTFESATPKGCVTVLDKWCSSEIVRLSCFHTHSSGACANSRVYASLSNAGWICKALDESCSCPDSRDQLNRLFHLCANNLTAVDVFVSGESNINTYRIPAIVQTNKETLLAFAEGRVYDSSDCHRKLIVMKRSTDLGNTWEKLQVLSDESKVHVVEIFTACCVFSSILPTSSCVLYRYCNFLSLCLDHTNQFE